MALRETALDARLAGEQPVHRLVQVVLVGVAQVELLGQRGGMPPPGGGELRAGVQQPSHDHGQDPVALRRTLRGDEPVQPQTPGHGQHRFDMAMGEGAFDGERFLGTDQALSLEHPAKALDLLRGPVGEVGQGAFADPTAFAPAFSKQRRGPGVAVGDGFNVHGNDHIQIRSLTSSNIGAITWEQKSSLVRDVLNLNSMGYRRSRPQIPGELRIKRKTDRYPKHAMYWRRVPTLLYALASKGSCRCFQNHPLSTLNKTGGSCPV